MEPAVPTMIQKAVFLDRDGVINNNEGKYYIGKKEEVEINPGVAGALRQLKEAGFMLIVITNQGGVGRGLYSRGEVEVVHRYIRELLQAGGAEIDDFYYCPHHPESGNCLCRKPLPLMIQKAMARYLICPGRSWFIGDSSRDTEAGTAAGIRTILIEPNSSLSGAVEQIILESGTDEP
jgi:D-glycero-D-manno-heptose 1,7-bisphosphate phosphatase